MIDIHTVKALINEDCFPLILKEGKVNGDSIRFDINFKTGRSSWSKNYSKPDQTITHYTLYAYKGRWHRYMAIMDKDTYKYALSLFYNRWNKRSRQEMMSKLNISIGHVNRLLNKGRATQC